jgi:hypothetical protein
MDEARGPERGILRKQQGPDGNGSRLNYVESGGREISYAFCFDVVMATNKQ